MTETTPDIAVKSNDLSAFGAARSTVQGTPLAADELEKMDATAGQAFISVSGNDLFEGQSRSEKPLCPEDTKIRLLGHWGSDPGMSFMYSHLDRLINKYDVNMIFLAGPGHGAPAVFPMRI